MLEIFINKNTENKEIALLENGHLVEYYIDEGNDLRKEGNIYIGIVKDVIKGMQAAFVDIGTEKNSFIHLKDVLPKIDETKNNVIFNIDIPFISDKGIKKFVSLEVFLEGFNRGDYTNKQISFFNFGE